MTQVIPENHLVCGPNCSPYLTLLSDLHSSLPLGLFQYNNLKSIRIRIFRSFSLFVVIAFVPSFYLLFSPKTKGSVPSSGMCLSLISLTKIAGPLIDHLGCHAILFKEFGNQMYGWKRMER